MAQDLIQSKHNNLKKLMDASKKEIIAALPKHVDPDRMLRVAMTEVRKNPRLLECDQASFLGAVIQASQLGLEPGGALGHCWLIPYRNKSQGIVECQFQIGYRGMLDLAYRSDRVSHAIARAVYDGDYFDYCFGTGEDVKHKPESLEGAPLTHTYCIVFLKSGGRLFDVMNRQQIDDTRKRSMSPDRGPWVTDFEAMAKKSSVRKLFKYTPISIEVQSAVGLDEMTDGENGQGNREKFIEITGRHIAPEETPISKAEALSQSLREEAPIAVDPEFDKAVRELDDPKMVK